MSKIKAKLATYLFNLVALTAFLFLLIYSLISKKMMIDFFTYASYYLIFAIIVLWALQLTLFLRTLNFSPGELLKKYWLGISIALVLTISVFASVSVRFKTLSDETNLLSISRAMLYDKTSVNPTMAKYYYNNQNTFNNEIPKRPLIYPFLVQIMHTFTGFRYQNAFAINFIVMFLFLSGVYIAVRKFLDIPSAIAAMFFIISYPVFTIFGTSGCFDLLNSCFFVMIMALTYHLIKKPSSTTFAFLFVSLLVFSNIRYESIFLLFVLPGLLLLFGKIKWEYLKKCSYLIFITPLVTLPYFWQRILKQNPFETPADAESFSLGLLWKNTSNIFINLIDINPKLPYASLLTIASILIFIYLAFEFLRKKICLQKPERHFVFILSITVAISSLIYLAYFFGMYTHPSAARFFIFLSIISALGPVLLKYFKPAFVSGTALLILSIVCFLFYHPIAVEGRFINALTGNRKTECCMDFLAGINDENILIIAASSNQYTALGYGSVNFVYANNNKDNVLQEAERHLFSRAFVFQEIEYETGKPNKDSTLHEDYKLKTLYELQITATEFLRISEVIIPQAIIAPVETED